MFVINDLDARDGLIYFEVPFTRFDVVAAWDKHQNYWLATDNGMAVASWLSAYDQWPKNWLAIISICNVKCFQEIFYTFGKQADEAARRLIITLLYLNQARQHSDSCRKIS